MPEDRSSDRNPSLSRRGVLQRSLLLGGSLAGAGLLAAGRTSQAPAAPSPAQDVRVLNFVLLLEYIEEAFYREARARGRLSGALALFVNTVARHEEAHVAFLERALGSRARPRPKLAFGSATVDERAFTDAAVALEDTVVAAYNGQAANLTGSTLAAAATIVSVEARHAAWIRAIAGLPPAAEPTDPLDSEAQVLAAIRRTGFLRS